MALVIRKHCERALELARRAWDLSIYTSQVEMPPEYPHTASSNHHQLLSSSFCLPFNSPLPHQLAFTNTHSL